MNEQLFVLASQKKTTNHILHLLLCVPTLGLWLIVWGLVASSNNRHNARIQRQMNHILGAKMDGRTDVEAYHLAKTAETKRSDRIFVVTLIVVSVGVFFLLR